MVTAGFIDTDENGPVGIHDWMEHTGAAIEKMAKKASENKSRREVARAQYELEKSCLRTSTDEVRSGNRTGMNPTKTRQDQTRQDQTSQDQEEEPSLVGARDPGTTDSVPGAHEWLRAFKPRHSEKYNRLTYGRGEQDARACGKLSDVLAGLPAQERSEAWDRRAEIIGEFLAKADSRTVAVAHSFAFFVEAFSALRIPLAARPKASDVAPKSARPVIPLPENWFEKSEVERKRREAHANGRSE